MTGYTYRSWDGSLSILNCELRHVLARQSEYAIFGSLNLCMRGIIDREIEDVDVFVSRRVWGELFAHRPRWIIETPNAGDPPILTLGTPHPLHLFYEWADERVHQDVADAIERNEEVDGFMLAPLDVILYMKEEALSYGTEKVQKHVPDIEAIRTYMSDAREYGI